MNPSISQEGNWIGNSNTLSPSKLYNASNAAEPLQQSQLGPRTNLRIKHSDSITEMPGQTHNYTQFVNDQKLTRIDELIASSASRPAISQGPFDSYAMSGSKKTYPSIVAGPSTGKPMLGSKVFNEKAVSQSEWRPQGDTQNFWQQLTSKGIKSEVAPKQQAPSNSSPTKLSAGTIPPLSIQELIRSLPRASSSINPYFSRRTEQKLAQLLTNRSKLEAYLHQLSSELSYVDTDTATNYQVLIALLKEVWKYEVVVEKKMEPAEEGLKIRFQNPAVTAKEMELARLKAELEERRNSAKKIIENYQASLRSLNSVILQLAKKQITLNEASKAAESQIANRQVSSSTQNLE